MALNPFERIPQRSQPFVCCKISHPPLGGSNVSDVYLMKREVGIAYLAKERKFEAIDGTLVTVINEFF